jgi:hypothetical protein
MKPVRNSRFSFFVQFPALKYSPKIKYGLFELQLRLFKFQLVQLKFEINELKV